jgi:ABC-type antimicrobial peptide transport system permease subunit
MEGSLASPSDLNGNGGFIALRTAMPPEQIEIGLRSTVRAIDPQLPLYQVQTMEHAISDSEAPRRFNTALISSFAGIAVLLAVLGIYSVIAFSVALRVQEMAIRLALGSQRVGIVRLIVVSGLKLAAVGCALGLAGAWAASHLLQRFLFGVHALDPLVLVLSTLALLALTLVATLAPARRAASVDLTQSLRAE